ncbi:queuosine precursor transporter [bacterium]|nr:queuosine precursor transporter [bacterium]
MKNKQNILFIVLGGFFIANALLAEFLGVKLFSVERTLGFEPLNLKILGQDGLGFTMTTGVLLWPVVFVFTDILNEYYGQRGIRLLSFLTAGLIAYGFLMIYLAINVEPADFWVVMKQEQGVEDMSLAFNAVYGQGLRIIIGSLVAFLVSQFVDVYVFTKIRSITGEKRIWLRATGSTLVSQLIDSYVVLFIAFAGQLPTIYILAIGVVNYVYKFVVAIISTPAIYVVHYFIERYLGKEEAEKMAASVHRSE